MIKRQLCRPEHEAGSILDEGHVYRDQIGAKHIAIQVVCQGTAHHTCGEQSIHVRCDVVLDCLHVPRIAGVGFRAHVGTAGPRPDAGSVVKKHKHCVIRNFSRKLYGRATQGCVAGQVDTRWHVTDDDHHVCSVESPWVVNCISIGSCIRTHGQDRDSAWGPHRGDYLGPDGSPRVGRDRSSLAPVIGSLLTRTNCMGVSCLIQSWCFCRSQCNVSVVRLWPIGADGWAFGRLGVILPSCANVLLPVLRPPCPGPPHRLPAGVIQRHRHIHRGAVRVEDTPGAVQQRQSSAEHGGCSRNLVLDVHLLAKAPVIKFRSTVPRRGDRALWDY